MRLHRGYVQVYTGNGKGKTTAALGLALRAAGAGLGVYILQFVKGNPYSEINSLRKIKNINIEQCGRGCFIKTRPSPRDIQYAGEGLKKLEKNICSGMYDLVVMDEINIAVKLKLLDVKDVVRIIKSKPRFVELVLTGRYCPNAIRKYADLVTDMKEIKHPYRKGVKARRGIEY